MLIKLGVDYRETKLALTQYIWVVTGGFAR